MKVVKDGLNALDKFRNKLQTTLAKPVDVHELKALSKEQKKYKILFEEADYLNAKVR